MENEKILILHGWGAGKKSWAKVKNLLAEQGIEAIIPDMPGFGEEAPPKKPWNNDDYLNWVLNFIESKNIKTPLVLVGHSFGGGIAIKLASQKPELVRALVLIASARISEQATLKKKVIGWLARFGKKLSFLPLSKDLRKAFYRFVVGSHDYEKAQSTMRETMRLVIKEDLKEAAHTIKAPTLILWGEKDKATPVENAYTLNKEIRDSKLEIIKDAPHALNIEEPQKIAQAIHKFLNTL